MATRRKDRLVWVDLEPTATIKPRSTEAFPMNKRLDVDRNQILEMACIITDGDLNIIAESPDLCIHWPENVLTNMEEWSQRHHDKSGLTQSCRSSTDTLQDVERKMLDFVKAHVPKGECPLAGNSIHCDRMFLSKYMPKFTSYLHYRVVDVSSVKELCKRWYRKEASDVPSKSLSHRALQDIRESIEELKYYRSTIFK